MKKNRLVRVSKRQSVLKLIANSPGLRYHQSKAAQKKHNPNKKPRPIIGQQKRIKALANVNVNKKSYQATAHQKLQTIKRGRCFHKYKLLGSSFPSTEGYCALLPPVELNKRSNLRRTHKFL